MAIVRALDIVPKDRDVTIVTDSQYAINCSNVWYKNWQQNGWKSTNGKVVENRDIVENIRSKITERENMGSQTLFEWIKGHANLAGNVEADKLAVEGARAAAGATT
jgi:ribonuclease HI